MSESEELKQKVLELEEKVKELSQEKDSNGKYSTQKSKNSSPYLALYILAAIFLVPMFLIYTLSADYKLKFLLTGSSWGDKITLKVKKCRSGDAQIPPFFGVKFYSEEGFVVKAQSDQETGEYEIWVWKDNIKEALKFKKENCSKFDIDNHLAKVKVNNVNTMSGKINVECSGPNKEKLSLQAEYDQCD